MKTNGKIIRLALLPFMLLALATMLSARDKNPSKPRKAVNQQADNTTSEGEKKFQTHCGRCHDAPDDIPRSVAGTVVKHMRVRANLSAADEKLILDYIRP
jgi:cytochrome c5